MTVPPECSALSQEVNQLIEVTSDWPIEDSGLPKPGLVVQLHQLAEKKAALDACLAQHPPGYQTQVVVHDFSAGGTTLSPPVRAVRWELAPASGLQHVLETQAVQDQTVLFWGTGAAGPGKSIGVSVHDAPNLLFAGPLFRSGARPALPPGAPGNPAGLIEIAIPTPPPPIQVTTINAMLPEVDAVLSTTPFVVAVTAPAPTVSLSAGTDDTPGTARLQLNGTVQLPASSGPIPFQFSATVTITPSADMNLPTKICKVAAASRPSLTTTAAEPLASLFALAAQTLGPLLSDRVLNLLQDSVLNPTILAAVAGAFGLPALPDGVLVSMRGITIHSTEIKFLPVLGAFGGLPSTLSHFPQSARASRREDRMQSHHEQVFVDPSR
jgi:hypothetical protein